MMSGLLSGIISAQPLALEYQTPIGAQPLGFMVEISGVNAGNFLDYNKDGVNEIIGYQTNQNGQKAFVAIDGVSNQIIAVLIGLYGNPATDYQFKGFYNVDNDPSVETIFRSKPPLYSHTVIADKEGTYLYPQDSMGVPGSPFNLLGIRNLDGDPSFEVAGTRLINDSLLYFKSLQIYGNGFTPGAAPHPETGSTGSPRNTPQFMIESQLPPWVTWPSFDRGYLPPTAKDFNGDGIDDLSFLNDSLLWVISGLDHSPLVSAPLNQLDAWEHAALIGYFDFYGTGVKQLLFGSMPDTFPAPTSLRQVSRLWVYDPSSGTLNFSLLPFMEQNFRLRAVADADDDGQFELIMQHEVNRRIAILGAPEDGVHNGPSGNGAGRGTIQSTFSGPYELEMKFQGPQGFSLAGLDERVFPESALDIDGDGKPDLPGWREMASDTAAAGFVVTDGATQEVLWDLDLESLSIPDTIKRFHGFFDVNGDGEKELIIGNRTIITLDGTVHQPFGPFRIAYVRDMDGDGYPEIIGRAANGRAQIWGKSAVTAVQQPAIAGELKTYPNPAQGEINIEYTLRERAPVRIRLVNALGQTAARIDNGIREAGSHTVRYQINPALAAGIYYIQLEAGADRICRPLFVNRN